MHIEFMQIQFRPWAYAEPRKYTEIEIRVRVEGREVTWRMAEPTDHFVSVFDRLIDMGRDAIKAELKYKRMAVATNPPAQEAR